MLEVSFVELFIRMIPEGLLFLLAAHVFTRTKLDIKKYLISVVILSIGGYIARSLPIDNGIHSILILIMFILLAINVNNIKPVKAIQAGILTMLVMFISEGINVAIIQLVFKKDINVIFQDPVIKQLYGSPSLLIFLGIVGLYHVVAAKKDKKKKLSNSEAV